LSPRTGALLLTVPVFALYFYLLGEFEPPLPIADRVAAWMLYAILAVMLIGMLAVRLEPRGMSYVFMLAALLQTFSMFLMLLEWQELETVVYLNVLLVLSLLLVSWRFRNVANLEAGKTESS
jgi:hypothetical protein